MVAVLQEILVMPNTPTSLIGLLVEKLIGILRDDAQKIQMVSPCENIILFKNWVFSKKKKEKCLKNLKRFVYSYLNNQKHV